MCSVYDVLFLNFDGNWSTTSMIWNTKDVNTVVVTKIKSNNFKLFFIC